MAGKRRTWVVAVVGPRPVSVDHDGVGLVRVVVVPHPDLQGSVVSDLDGVGQNFMALVSVLRDGINLYDPTRKTNTARGNKFAGITLKLTDLPWGP